MPGDVNLSFTQALQMVALAPCLLVIFYLIITSRNKKLVIIPVLYFLSIMSGLLLLLLPAFIPLNNYSQLKLLFAFGDIFVPTLSFLLIFQFLLNRMPPIIYWPVLLVPAIATGPFVYNMIYKDELCFGIDTCFSSVSAMHLNNVLISSFIYMLLILIVSRRSTEIIGTQELRKYKYWLVLSLIIYNIFLFALELATVKEILLPQRYIFGKTMVTIAFIYMVMTSIFRVFTDLFDIKPLIHLKRNTLTKYEQELAIKIGHLLGNEKMYRQSGFNRTKLAETLHIGEHLLSRIINIEFKKSFSDIANDYRVREARELLERTEIPVTSISFDVGFNSIASFNRVFKNYTGKAPTEYREDMRKDII
ncbi:MAG: bacterial regulatory helix-turn-helix s, AraC family protein [Rickettsiaceae bacterium]|jgi:AraC-like DNA-binding protein|nr:bacterial regulatory helix-turn-helix s, AraC family protein [Rickettsiaceae bacterium]